MDDPNLQDLVKLQNDSLKGIQRLNQTFISSHALFPLHPTPPPSVSHLILNGQQKPHGRRAQWMRHKRSGMFCVLSGQDAKKLRKRQSYWYGQVHVRWHDQLELIQHVLQSAGIWAKALRSCVQTMSRAKRRFQDRQFLLNNNFPSKEL